MDNGNWYANSYRRNLVDMHIDDWNDAFLAKFDATNYVTLLKLANVQTAMVYANSSVGLCYWPTKTGRMHRNLKGRDILGETLNLCRAEGITTVVYYSEIFNNWAYDEHPQWRTVDLQGGHSGTQEKGRCLPTGTDYAARIQTRIGIYKSSADRTRRRLRIQRNVFGYELLASRMLLQELSPEVR